MARVTLTIHVHQFEVSGLPDDEDVQRYAADSILDRYRDGGRVGQVELEWDLEAVEDD